MYIAYKHSQTQVTETETDSQRQAQSQSLTQPQTQQQHIAIIIMSRGAFVLFQVPANACSEAFLPERCEPFGWCCWGPLVSCRLKLASKNTQSHLHSEKYTHIWMFFRFCRYLHAMLSCFRMRPKMMNKAHQLKINIEWHQWNIHLIVCDAFFLSKFMYQAVQLRHYALHHTGPRWSRHTLLQCSQILRYTKWHILCKNYSNVSTCS